jgi:hypothetical protein
MKQERLFKNFQKEISPRSKAPVASLNGKTKE